MLFSHAMRSYRLSDFDYALPAELIAQVPVGERTGSRLLHVDGLRLTDLAFTGLINLLRAGDLLVFNDTSVIKSRLHAIKPTGGRVELMVERVLGIHEGLFQLRASHLPRVGGSMDLRDGTRAPVVLRDDRFFHLR